MIAGGPEEVCGHVPMDGIHWLGSGSAESNRKRCHAPASIVSRAPLPFFAQHLVSSLMFD